MKVYTVLTGTRVPQRYVSRVKYSQYRLHRFRRGATHKSFLFHRPTYRVGMSIDISSNKLRTLKILVATSKGCNMIK